MELGSNNDVDGGDEQDFQSVHIKVPSSTVITSLKKENDELKNKIKILVGRMELRKQESELLKVRVDQLEAGGGQQKRTVADLNSWKSTVSSSMTEVVGRVRQLEDELNQYKLQSATSKKSKSMVANKFRKAARRRMKNLENRLKLMEGAKEKTMISNSSSRSGSGQGLLLSEVEVEVKEEVELMRSTVEELANSASIVTGRDDESQDNEFPLQGQQECQQRNGPVSVEASEVEVPKLEARTEDLVHEMPNSDSLVDENSSSTQISTLARDQGTVTFSTSNGLHNNSSASMCLPSTSSLAVLQQLQQHQSTPCTSRNNENQGQQADDPPTSAWLLQEVPTRSPYFPQIGDDIVYFRQGHAEYLEEVKARGAYDVVMSEIPWIKDPSIPAEMAGVVVNIKFEYHGTPPLALVRVELAPTIAKTGKKIGKHFEIIYHDMDNVVDFLLLRQFYDKAVAHRGKWKPGDRFRFLVGRSWLIGKIVRVEPYNSEFPKSNFFCFKTLYSAGANHHSPWEIDFIPSHWSSGVYFTDILDDNFYILDELSKPEIPATDEELKASLYQYQPNTCSLLLKESESEIIASVLSKVMKSPFASKFLHFNANQLLNASRVVYKIDLNKIRARLENHFYRRLAPLLFDIEQIAKNAELMFLPSSDYVKLSYVLKDDLLKKICLAMVDRKRCNELELHRGNLENDSNEVARVRQMEAPTTSQINNNVKTVNYIKGGQTRQVIAARLANNKRPYSDMTNNSSSSPTRGGPQEKVYQLRERTTSGKEHNKNDADAEDEHVDSAEENSQLKKGRHST